MNLRKKPVRRRKKTANVSVSRSHKKKRVRRGQSRYDRHDPFYMQAKREGYVARSIYKLEEIDKAFGIFKKDSIVLDLGCAPGSWMQYIVNVVDPERGGQAVGIDLLDPHVAFPPHIKIIKGDIFKVSPKELRPDNMKEDGQVFDVIMSDMAPNTTGIASVDQDRSIALCERVLWVARNNLKLDGALIVKVLEGGGMQQLVAEYKKYFQQVKIKRPKSTRVGSKETFIVAMGFSVVE